MNDAQVGSIIRAVRIRRGLRQLDVAAVARVSPATVSVIERGGLEEVTVRAARSVGAALGVWLPFDPRWKGADLARLLDERHAEMVREVTRRLVARGWVARPELTFGVFGERGSIDVLAWHPTECAVLVVEVKTELVDLQDLLSTLDRKRRLAARIAGDLGWETSSVGAALVLPAETWARHAVRTFAPVFDAALPARTLEIRRWLRRPRRNLRGIWFLPNCSTADAKRGRGGVRRVRKRIRVDPPRD